MTFCILGFPLQSAETLLNKLYVATQIGAKNRIEVYDIEKKILIDSVEIDLGTDVAKQLGINHKGTKLFATTDKREFLIIDIKTKKIERRVKLEGTSDRNQFVVSPNDSDTIYFNITATDPKGIKFGIFDATKKDSVVNYINFTSDKSLETSSITITPNGEKVYFVYTFTSTSETNVGSYNVITNEITWTAIQPLIRSSTGPIQAINNDEIYFSNGEGGGFLTIIQTKDNSITDKAIPNFLFSLTLNPIKAAFRVYSSVFTNKGIGIQQINTANNTLIGPVTIINKESVNLITSACSVQQIFAQFVTNPLDANLKVFDFANNNITPANPATISFKGGVRSIVLGPEGQAPKVVIEPPRRLRGKVIRNRFLTQTDIINQITWKASRDPTVVVYSIYRDDEFIADVLADDLLKFNDHNRVPGKQYTYKVIAITESDEMSNPVTTTVQD